MQLNIIRNKILKCFYQEFDQILKKVPIPTITKQDTLLDT